MTQSDTGPLRHFRFDEASGTAAIDSGSTPAGGTLRLAPGSYFGPVAIKKPMTLDGGGQARFQ